MYRTISLLMAIVFLIGLFGCEEKITKPQTKDPLEAATYDYLNLIKAKNWDAAMAKHSEQTNKYYKKEVFIEDATTNILPKVDAVYITKIEKRKLDAMVFTQFKPKSSWETYNTLERAKIKLKFLYKDGNWFVDYPEVVAKGLEEETKVKERLARVAKWKDKIIIHKFTVNNAITEEGPKLVFDGEFENKSEEHLDMAMVMIDFFDGNGKKVYNIAVVPIYVSQWEKKDGLGPGKKTPFQQTIISRIPDTWNGDIKYYLYDAGVMPNKR